MALRLPVEHWTGPKFVCKHTPRPRIQNAMEFVRTDSLNSVLILVSAIYTQHLSLFFAIYMRRFNMSSTAGSVESPPFPVILRMRLFHHFLFV